MQRQCRGSVKAVRRQCKGRGRVNVVQKQCKRSVNAVQRQCEGRCSAKVVQPGGMDDKGGADAEQRQTSRLIGAEAVHGQCNVAVKTVRRRFEGGRNADALQQLSQRRVDGV